jgi:hypothetical protein
MGQLNPKTNPAVNPKALFLPPSTNVGYVGARSAVLFLGLAAVATLVPGLIHSVLPDGGAQSIAGLDLGDRAALVRGVFAWEGATQLALGVAMLAVAIRYRPLTPLFLSLIILERGLMTLQGLMLRPPATDHHPPEHFASPIIGLLALIFLALSLRAHRS